MNKALKKVLKLKSNKKSTQYFAKKKWIYSKKDSKKCTQSKKSELKKVYPLKKVNLRRAPKIE